MTNLKTKQLKKLKDLIWVKGQYIEALTVKQNIIEKEYNRIENIKRIEIEELEKLNQEFKFLSLN